MALNPFARGAIFLAMSSNEPMRCGLELSIRAEVEASPNGVLPAAIERFDFPLEAGFSGRSKDRGHAKTKAAMNKPSEIADMAMRALEDCIVVELGKVGSPQVEPMAFHGSQARRLNRSLGHDRAHRKVSPEGKSGEGVKVAPA